MHSDHVFQDNTDAQTPGLDYDVTTFGLGWFGHAAATPFDLPRLSFDYFIANHVSLGDALAYQTSNISSNGNRGVGAPKHQWVRLESRAPFVFVAAAHFALLLGPSLDLAFTGRIKPSQAPELNHSYRSIGLQLGLLGWI